MQFDPTYNYGDSDLTNKENLVCWKFAELIKTLITLTCIAERQIEIMGAGVVTGEMAEDFDTYFTLSYKQFKEYHLLSEIAIKKLNQLDNFLDQRCGDKASDFWDDFKLSTNKDWEIVRVQASEILTLLNMNNLDIEFEREEKYETTTEGQKLLIQSTKTRLVTKNGS